MLFTSFVFAGLFLPICTLVFWLAPSPKFKRAILLIGSLIFYGYWEPIYLALLLGFVGIAWICAQLAEATRRAWPIWLATISLLGGLAYYKYFGFFVQISQDLGVLNTSFRAPELALPLGISFIAFQALGYVIDVHRGEFPAEKRFSVVLLFKAFFPQLIAGPICRAHELIPQLKGVFTFRFNQFSSGFAIFTLGLFLKEFFADGIAPLVDSLYADNFNHTFVTAWAAALGFGSQIYADFWGYSTMAVGLARMFGICIPINFNLPYIARSLREFWRRWHITLSQWLRDYLYIPLGGSRNGAYRNTFALMLTMLLGGLWHGANYTFIIWGAIHGIAQVIEHQLFKDRLNYLRYGSFFLRTSIWTIGWLYTFIVVFVAWVFFRAGNVNQAAEIVGMMFSLSLLEPVTLPPNVAKIAFFVIALSALQFPITWALTKLRNEQWPPATALTVALWAIVASVILGAPVAVPFIYFQF